MDDAEQLMPTYLRFVRGVVDSNDLPLNISREILQKNKQIDAIRSGSVKKVLGVLDNIASNDAEKYATFWKQFGRVLKEGIIEDSKNQESLSKLLRFSSTHADSDEQTVSLEEYIGRMKEDQESIYYITAESLATAKNSPHLEIFKDKGVEVLLMTDEVDEWVVTHLTEFQGKSLKSVSKGALDLGKLEGDDEKSKAKQAESEHKDIVDRIYKSLGERVKEVRISHRLTTSPACLVADEHEIGAHLERLLKATGQQISGSKPIMELNPEHPIVKRLGEESNAQRFDDWAHILFDQALLSEGGQPDDPAGFVKRLNEMFVVLTGDAPRIWTPNG